MRGVAGWQRGGGGCRAAVVSCSPGPPPAASGTAWERREGLRQQALGDVSLEACLENRRDPDLGLETGGR